MRDILEDTVPLALILLAAFIFYGLGLLVLRDMEAHRVRYEQCLAADKQWVEGSCVK